MKTIVVLFSFLFYLSNTAKSQYITIPDQNFVNWLQANIPAAMSAAQMDTTHPDVINRRVIDVENLSIADLTGIQYFDGLTTLDCGNGNLAPNPNTLSSLPRLPFFLDTLICGGNQLTSLPTLPSSLTVLKCYSNQLVSLPTLPNTLIYLDCSNNQLSNLPNLPSSITHIECGNNSITSLPALPNSLVDLRCYRNHITSLPVLSSSLIYLSCEYNQLSSLPSLPNSLQGLYCGFNQLTSLPILTNSIYELHCNNNQLTALPALPNSLIYFICDNNQINVLPTLPISINQLICNDNNISCFPTFPNSLNEVNYFDISNNPFSCLPNFVGAMNTFTLTYPLCALGNPNGCPIAEGIVGFAYKDVNNNCIKDAVDIGLKNIPFELYDNNNNYISKTFSSINGVYNFPETIGTYTVVSDTVGLNIDIDCLYPGIDSLVTISTLASDIDFSFTCKPGFDLGIQSILTDGIIFPGQEHTLKINAGDISHWFNLNCADGTSGQLQITVFGPINFTGVAAGSLTPSVVGNTYTYAIADFALINNNSDFNLLFTTNTTAQAGDTICVSASITPTIGDNNLSNNNYSFCYHVVNSHDPNIKEVYPTNVIPKYSGWFTYTIHFQNTGTAPAINIVIEDTIDNNLDLSSFKLLNYSHENITTLKGNKVTFNFININLPDSNTNLEGSIGYIQYKLKPKTNLPANTKILNTAYIYFDFNPAIVTNTTTNQFIEPLSVRQNSYFKISISPNPNNGLFSLSKMDYEMQNIKTISIRSIDNKFQKKLPLQREQNLSDLAPGVYVIEISLNDGSLFYCKLVTE